MNKLLEWALDIVWGTEIGEQVTKLKDNVLKTVWVQTETKEALQEANLDQVATTYEALAVKVGITDQKEMITKFIVKGKGEGEFTEIHNTIKTLAQKWGADVSTLDDVLTTHKLTGWSKIWFTIANALGWFVRKTLEKLNFIHSSKDLGKMVFAINEITTKIDMSKLESIWEEINSENIENIESKEITNPMIEWVITSTFDDKRDRDHNHDGEKDDHGAIDIVSYISKSLLAVADAKVISKWFDHVYGAGNFIIIQFVYHGKTYKASYSHMLESAQLEIGAIVKKGDILWEMWNTGHASRGAHLHFKLKEVTEDKDIVIDPLTVFNPKWFRYKQWNDNVKFDDWKGADKYK